MSYSIADIDTQSEPCQRFFRDGLTTSFTKILTDEAVSGWKYEIHVRKMHANTNAYHVSARLVYSAAVLDYDEWGEIYKTLVVGVSFYSWRW